MELEAPTTVFTSSDTSDWISEDSEASSDPADPNGVAALLRKDERARERRKEAARAKRHQRAPPEPAEPPRAKARAGSAASSSLAYESRASSVGFARRGGDEAASSGTGGPSHPPGQREDRSGQGQQEESWLQAAAWPQTAWQTVWQGEEANRRWAEWYRNWRYRTDSSGWHR